MATVPRPHRDHTSSAFRGVYSKDNRMVEPFWLTQEPLAFSSREAPRGREDSRRILGDDEAVSADPAGQLRVCGRIVAVDAAAENGDGRTSGLERASVR